MISNNKHNSFPSRSSMNPFRKSTYDANSKNHQSLKITTTTTLVAEEIERQSLSSFVKPPSKVRQRISSLFSRSNSPSLASPKESTHSKRYSSLSIIEPVSTATKTTFSKENDNQSVASNSSLSSSANSDHMPASPTDFSSLHQHIHHEEDQQDRIYQPVLEELQSKTSIPSLASQIHAVLGSTLEEVDEEIDRDWQNRRNVLRESLLYLPPRIVPTRYQSYSDMKK